MNKLIYAMFATALAGATACSNQEISNQNSENKLEAKTIKMIVEEGKEIEIGDPIMLLNNLGDTIAPMGKYSWTPEAQEDNDIILVLGDENWAFVDANGKEMDYQPFVFDNAPDEISEGLMRVKNKEGKMGYADSIGHIVIEPQFFFAQPWEDGFGRVAKEGTEEKLGEHTSIKVDKWYLVDIDGNLKEAK